MRPALLCSRLRYTDEQYLDRLAAVDPTRTYFSVLLQDTQAYTEELKALRNAGGNFYALRATMDDKKKVKMLVRREVR